MQGQAGGGGGVVAAFLVGQGLTATKPGMEPAPQNADPPPPAQGAGQIQGGEHVPEQRDI